jgi:hypothetical protein
VSTDRRRFAIAAALWLALLGFGVFASGSSDGKKDKEKDYGLLFGTAFGPNDLPIHGVKVIIRPVGKKHPSYEQQSDHRGEFAQRLPPGPCDYLVTGEIEVPIANGKGKKKMRLKGEVTVHLDGQERRDFSLHMKE